LVITDDEVTKVIKGKIQSMSFSNKNEYLNKDCLLIFSTLPGHEC